MTKKKITIDSFLYPSPPSWNAWLSSDQADLQWALAKQALLFTWPQFLAFKILFSSSSSGLWTAILKIPGGEGTEKETITTTFLAFYFFLVFGVYRYDRSLACLRVYFYFSRNAWCGRKKEKLKKGRMKQKQLIKDDQADQCLVAPMPHYFYIS